MARKNATPRASASRPGVRADQHSRNRPSLTPLSDGTVSSSDDGESASKPVPARIESGCNGDDPPLEFIKLLHKQRSAGYAFIPLVGAGLSAPSGIPIIQQLKSYLVKCICRALGLDHPLAWKPESGEPRDHALLDLSGERRWLPGRDEWPPFGDPQIYSRDTVDWMARLERTFVRMREFAARGPEHEYPELGIVQEALGASAEWRSSLQFLARLRTRGNGRTLILGPPDHDIIDQFVLNVILGKRPTLGHRMLAMLASPLRISLALTTNFDDLLEQAFAQSNNPLTPFDVHIDAGLPPLRDVAGKNSLVKLHGGRFGMRADYSLDTPPSDRDLRSFVSYFVDRTISDDEWRTIGEQVDVAEAHAPPTVPRTLGARRHLLVIGVGADDERINHLIRAAARAIEGLEVFWVCYQRREVQKIDDLLKDLGVSDGRRHILQHRFPGLLFLQAYQVLTGGLPPLNAVFPAAHRVPVPPEWPSAIARVADERFTKCQEAIRERIGRCLRLSESRPIPHDGSLKPRPVRCVLVHGPYRVLAGGMSAAAAVYDELLESHQAVWIDLDETGSVNDLIETIIHTVARKAGIVDWMPVVLQQDDDPVGSRLAQIRELERVTSSPDRRWVIFLNARSGPGANLLMDRDEVGSHEGKHNGWMDWSRSSSPEGWGDGTSNSEAVAELIHEMAGARCPNVTVVLMCFTGELTEVLEYRLMPDAPVLLDQSPAIFGVRDSEVVSSEDQIVERALDWIGKDEHRQHFLAATVFANRTRYPAMFWHWPFHDTTATSLVERMDRANMFLGELEKCWVLRRKVGGFIWMQCRIRNMLRQRLITERPAGPFSAAQIHAGLAAWYHRLFRACEDPAAVFEIVYHRCEQILALLHTKDAESDFPIEQAFVDIENSLRSGRSSMLSFGFSKGICRRLQDLRQVLIPRIERELSPATGRGNDSVDERISRHLHNVRRLSLELNRAIAREVGENAVAFRRHRELREEQFCYRNPDSNREQVSRTLQSRSEEERPSRRELLERHASAGESFGEWCEFVNESSTLGIAVRSYHFSERQFNYVQGGCKLPERLRDLQASLYDGSVSGSHRRQLLEWLENYHRDEPTAATQDVGQIVTAFRRRQQVLLATGHAWHTQASRLQWCNRDETAGDADELSAKADERYAQAARCFEIGMELLSWVRTKAQSSPADRLPDLDHEWQRLTVQHALTHSFEGDFRKASVRLNDAEASLNTRGFAPDSLERGIVELHRAEVLTQEAVYQEREGKTRTPTSLARSRLDILKSYCRGLDCRDRGSALRDVVSEHEHYRGSARTEEPTFRGALSSIDDAWQALTRAEPCLHRYRKNVWWTTWYFELQIKLIELKVFACLQTHLLCDDRARTRLQLPFLGPEAAAYGVPTLAERIVDNADRMIRLDLFRMARVVESFSHCLLAGMLWLQWQRDEAPEVRRPLQERIRVLRLKLREIRAGLNRRCRQRERLDEQWNATALDPHVQAYVSHVKTLSGSLLDIPQAEGPA